MDILEGFEYASNSEYASVTQAFLQNHPPYSQYARPWTYISYKYVKVEQSFVLTVF